jgi:hypothetical protein
MNQFVGTWIVPFGKFKDRTYHDMITEDIPYTRWYVTIIKSCRVKLYLMEVLASLDELLPKPVLKRQTNVIEDDSIMLGLDDSIPKTPV